MHSAFPLRGLGAPDARDGRVGRAGTHVGAHEIKRTPNLGVRTRGSYVQPTIVVCFQKIELPEAFPFCGMRG